MRADAPAFIPSQLITTTSITTTIPTTTRRRRTATNSDSNGISTTLIAATTTSNTCSPSCPASSNNPNNRHHQQQQQQQNSKSGKSGKRGGRRRRRRKTKKNGDCGDSGIGEGENGDHRESENYNGEADDATVNVDTDINTDAVQVHPKSMSMSKSQPQPQSRGRGKIKKNHHHYHQHHQQRNNHIHTNNKKNRRRRRKGIGEDEKKLYENFSQQGHSIDNKWKGNGNGDGNGDGNDDGDGNCGGSSGVNINDTVYKRGDRVLGFTRFGAYADIVNAPPQFLKRLPDSWSFAQGASFIVQALTAWHGLVEIGRMPIVVPVDCNDNDEKETEEEMKKTKTRKTKEKPFVVIVHSAAGGVGIWASEIAARRGGTVIGIVGNEAKANVFYDRIKQFSPNSQVMIRGEERDFHQRLAKTLQSIHSHSISVDDKVSFEISKSKLNNMDLKEMAKEGYGADIVMESLGGRYFQASFDSINDGGALVTFGSTSYVTPGLGLNLLRLVYRYITRPRVDPGSLTSRNIRLCGFNLIYLTQKTSELRRELNECISCLSGLDECHQTNEDVPLDNIIPPIIGEAFDFRTKAVEALERLKGGKTVGKVVLENDDNPFHQSIEI
mmetsp:Transcript_10399/g.15663  ORF Transcript_10399/g.15663 Transcript_10399/m.15663 type:complete len:611 (-) Transcript_10399:2555-4387(-)